MTDLAGNDAGQQTKGDAPSMQLTAAGARTPPSAPLHAAPPHNQVHFLR